MNYLMIGAILGCFVVILGAFGAHGLESMIGDKMDTFKTGVQYHMFHGLGLIITGILSKVFE